MGKAQYVIGFSEVRPLLVCGWLWPDCEISAQFGKVEACIVDRFNVKGLVGVWKPHVRHGYMGE